LPADLQANVTQAMNEATDKEREYAQELNDSQLEQIKAYAKKTGKLTIYELTAEQKEAWRKAVSKIYPEFYSDRKIGKDLIEKTIATK
jgi:C4-dicarboxylate-binding protein DctP